MSYTHLSQEERYQIEWMMKGGWTLAEVARHIGRHVTTLRRERRRNAEPDGSYAARGAQRRSRKRRHDASSQPRISEPTWVLIELRLREEWSPEQIAGHGDLDISHERIYQHVAEDRRKGGTLWKHLRCRKRRRRRNGTSRERQRFGGRRIQQRPAIVTERRRIGDWEGDTIVGSGIARVVTLVERKSGFTRLRRVSSGQAQPTMRAVVQALHPLMDHVHSLTLDNGSEFAEHGLIDVALETRCYFADPFASWQRGCNENLNGLLRQYFPKRSDLGAITDEELQRIEDRLNDRPRKRLGYRSPREVFEAHLKRGALRG